MTDDEFTRRKEELLTRVDLTEIVDALGLERKGKEARCPNHNDTGRPNLHIYKDRVHCFACDWNVDAFGLVEKAKGLDFKGAFDFLAARYGLPLIGDYRKSGKTKTQGKPEGLGYGSKGKEPTVYPKPAKLPDGPSPYLDAQVVDQAPPPNRLNQEKSEGADAGKVTTDQAAVALEVDYLGPAVWRSQETDRTVIVTGFFGEVDGLPWYRIAGSKTGIPGDQLRRVGPSGLGYKSEGNGAKTYPNNQELPVDLVADFPVYADAWAYWKDAGEWYDASLWKDQETGLFRVGRPQRPIFEEDEVVESVSPPDPPRATAAPTTNLSLRVRVFADLLGFTVPGSTTDAGLWLQREKGILPATLDAFGVAWLEDLPAAYADLRNRYGADVLRRFGLLTDKDVSPFIFHRLLFPFYWKGQPVDAQGRNVKATDKNNRFRNTGGANPIPYNADALLKARETGDPVFLCEGATDTLTLAQSGRLAVGIVGTGGFKAAWLPYFDGLRVFLALDSDEAGQKSAKSITKTFLDDGQPAPRVVKLPDGVKDVNEFFRGK